MLLYWQIHVNLNVSYLRHFHLIKKIMLCSLESPCIILDLCIVRLSTKHVLNEVPTNNRIAE